MSTLAIAADERVRNVRFDADSIIVERMDGRVISAPLAWFPRLSAAGADHLAQWEVCAGGYGIHWESLDEDLSTEGLLRGAPAPRSAGR